MNTAGNWRAGRSGTSSMMAARLAANTPAVSCGGPRTSSAAASGIVGSRRSTRHYRDLEHNAKVGRR